MGQDRFPHCRALEFSCQFCEVLESQGLMNAEVSQLLFLPSLSSGLFCPLLPLSLSCSISTLFPEILLSMKLGFERV